MNEELLIKAMELFDSAEKWNAFCELINKNGSIQDKWWKKLQTEIFQQEIKSNNPDWDIHIWNHWDIMWYIKGESNKSLAVHFWGGVFRVFHNYGELDTEKVNKLLQNPKFQAITNCFDRIDGKNHDTIGWEHYNFSFGTPYDGKFPDAKTLSWYAGNKTNEFADQLLSKVKKFQTPEVTELFREINTTCKK